MLPLQTAYIRPSFVRFDNCLNLHETVLPFRFRVQPPWRRRGWFFPRLRTRYVLVQLWASTTRKHQASVLYLWVLGPTIQQSKDTHRGNPRTRLLFFLSPVNLSARVVVVFQDMHVWNYLESNISLSFTLHDTLRSVQLNHFSLFSFLFSPLHFDFNHFTVWTVEIVQLWKHFTSVSCFFFFHTALYLQASANNPFLFFYPPCI